MQYFIWWFTWLFYHCVMRWYEREPNMARIVFLQTIFFWKSHRCNNQRSTYMHSIFPSCKLHSTADHSSLKHSTTRQDNVLKGHVLFLNVSALRQGRWLDPFQRPFDTYSASGEGLDLANCQPVMRPLEILATCNMHQFLSNDADFAPMSWTKKGCAATASSMVVWLIFLSIEAQF